MIYVCRVDTGSRHVFDFADGIENVGSLATAIEKQFKIDKSKQILLISGGEVLDDYSRKFYGFGFGCEESPIYLIDKSNVEKREPPAADTPFDLLNIQDLKQEINAAISLKSSFQTLQTRAQLTFRVNELDKKLNKICQSLYDEQYWQYQGYLALVANLDDYVNSFRKKEQAVREQFENYINNSKNYQILMKESGVVYNIDNIPPNINKYINILSKIRLLPSLISNEQSTINDDSTTINSTIEQSLNQNLTSKTSNQLKRLKHTNLFNSFSSQSISNLQSTQLLNGSPNNDNNNNKNTNNQNNFNSDDKITLLDWIKSTDPNNKLNSVIDETKEILENFDKNFKWNELNTKINKLLSQMETNQHMREIEGLTKRLEDLKSFLDESNKFLASQNEISESLRSNYERASMLKDESILHDLCKAHERQLEIFKSNHSNMLEISYKINKAKLELIRVIHSRLHWIMQVQKQIADYDFQIQIYFKQLRRLNVRLKLMEQLKIAPYVYLYSMKETLRRMEFSKIYKNFARLINTLLNNIYENEMNQRKLFNSKTASLSQHFILNILFRSLNDKIEPLMSDLKLNFDDKLPNLNESDVNLIENEIINYLKIPSETSIGSGSSSESAPSSSSSSSSATESSASSSSTSTSNLTFENESFILKELNIDLNTDKSNNNNNNNNSNLNTDNSKHLFILNKLIDLLTNTENGEIKKLESIQDQNGNEHIKETIKNLRSRLHETKSILINYQSDINKYISKLTNLNQKNTEIDKGRSEASQKENETNQEFDSKKCLNYIENCLKQNQNFSATNLNENETNFLNSFKDLFDQYKQEQEVKLNQEVKTNLEKLKKNFNAENQIKFNEAIKRVVLEKDKQIEELKQKEQENMNKINQLKQELDKSKLNYLNEPSEMNLQNDLISNDLLLNSDPNETKTKLKEIMLQEKINQLQKQLNMFTTLPLTNNFYETVQLNSCNIDDLVLAVYCDEYSSYKVIHKTSNYLHFVYSAVFKNCEQKLSLKAPFSTGKLNTTSSEYSSSPSNDQAQLEVQFSEQENNSSGITNEHNLATQVNITSSLISTESSPPNKMTNQASELTENSDNMFTGERHPQWFVGKVLVKEFCVARKESNRFKVPSGTRFYRVKLKPYNLF